MEDGPHIEITGEGKPVEYLTPTEQWTALIAKTEALFDDEQTPVIWDSDEAQKKLILEKLAMPSEDGRSTSVVYRLIMTHMFDGDRMSVLGFGPDQPLVTLMYGEVMQEIEAGLASTMEENAELLLRYYLGTHPNASNI